MELVSKATDKWSLSTEDANTELGGSSRARGTVKRVHPILLFRLVVTTLQLDLHSTITTSPQHKGEDEGITQDVDGPGRGRDGAPQF
jgi:hypothetical protein